MRYERKEKILIFGILLLLVCGVSIGFASFSSVLTIDPSAVISPDPGDFSIKFSSSPTALATDPVVPSSKSSDLETTDATIINSSSPSIRGYSAVFTEDGQYVTYSFYVRNTGEYPAYLNSIRYLTNKSCSAISGTDEDSVADSCNNINTATTVKVGNVTATQTKTDITGETLSPGETKLVEVTFEYIDGGSVIDGDFSIEFPTISLYYASTTGINKPTEKCTLTLKDNDLSGNITKSDEITCGTESFYVIDNRNGLIDLLSKYNLTLSKNESKQDISGAINGTYFSSGIYWYDSSNSLYIIDSNYATSGKTYPYIYGNYPENNIYQYVYAYKKTLEHLGMNVIDATLMSYEQAIYLGCSSNSCLSAPFWVKSTSYWTGSSNILNDVWYVNNDGQFGALPYSNDSVGIRPVITILEDDLR